MAVSVVMVGVVISIVFIYVSYTCTFVILQHNFTFLQRHSTNFNYSLGLTVTVLVNTVGHKVRFRHGV